MAKKKRKRMGRPTLSQKRPGPATFIGLKIGDELLARVDRFRKATEEDDAPARSAAIRALIEAGLKAEGF
jgi:hypothetical protein